MTQPRFTLDATPRYHVISRCVRRGFLCGLGHHTDSSFERWRGLNLAFVGVADSGTPTFLTLVGLGLYLRPSCA